MQANPILPNNNPPSFFKTYLFEPILKVVKAALRTLFQFVDFLREFSGADFQMPSRVAVIQHFERIHTPDEQNQIYEKIGIAHGDRIRWNEMIWNRSKEENIALGRRMGSENPYLLFE